MQIHYFSVHPTKTVGRVVGSKYFGADYEYTKDELGPVHQYKLVLPGLYQVVGGRDPKPQYIILDGKEIHEIQLTQAAGIAELMDAGLSFAAALRQTAATDV